jgi:hypothetical protein
MFLATRIAASAPPSAAQNVLQRRAIQCSFSSVFHIRNANGGAITKESQAAEAIFTRAVIWPLCAMGILGGGVAVKRRFIVDGSTRSL